MCANALIPDPRRIEAYARVHTIEQIMTMLLGQLADPPRYRRWLESQSDQTLSEHLAIILDGEAA